MILKGLFPEPVHYLYRRIRPNPFSFVRDRLLIIRPERLQTG
jgi:hypothetical protein